MGMEPVSREAARNGKTWPVEGPTLLLLAATYLLFGLVTYFHAALPWWLLAPAGGFLVCLHGSLQHEVVHGHPTRWRRLNEALVFPNLGLLTPYLLYRKFHLRHHRNEALTHPLDDPESFYVTAEAWADTPAAGRALLRVLNTAAGRLLLGPPVTALRLWWHELVRLTRGDRSHLAAWALHLPAVGLVLAWVLLVCGMPWWIYLGCFAYPGLSLTLLRSFLEHQAHETVEGRSVIVEAGPVMSLLYLNNNLHALHHREPGRAWYDLPARFRRERKALLAANGGYRYRGYDEVVARHFLSPKEPPVHPLLGTKPKAAQA